MRKVLSIILLLCCIAGTVAPVSASDDPSSGQIELQLEVDREKVKTGDTIQFGVKVALQPGWHIYWKNPGEAGLPTRMSVESSAELSCGEMMWPRPKSFTQPGGIVGYGYEGDATFLSECTVEGGSVATGYLKGEVKVSWLLCSDRLCVPGRESLPFQVAFGEKSEVVNESFFTSAKQQVPTAPGVGEMAIERVGNFVESTGEGVFQLKASFPQEWEMVEWFPYVDRAYTLEKVVASGEGKEHSLSIDLKRRKGAEPKSEQIEFVVVLKNEKETKAYTYQMPISS